MGEVYLDRKMLKWLPFQALPEQGDDLAVLFGVAMPKKPELSEDELTLMQYRFEIAWMRKETVWITYFRQGQFHQIEDWIVGFDQGTKCLQLRSMVLAVEEIVTIE